MKTSSNKQLKRLTAWKPNTGSPFVVALAPANSPTPPTAVVSYITNGNSLKLVRNLTGIIVLPIRVIDCLDTLSGCIISLWLQPGAWIRSWSKVIEKQKDPGMGRVIQ